MRGSSSGVFVILIGVAVVVVGLLMYAGALSWFGRLPGDLRFGGERTRVFIPLASMLVVSLLLSLVMWVVRRFF
jgi:H+/Cl- antiporter ClcA